MYDRDTVMLEKYDLTVKNIRKVRNGWLCIAQEGLFLWKESKSREERLGLEKEICCQAENMGLSHIWNCAGGNGFLRMDRWVRNREGQLLTEDEYGRMFVLKEWTEGRECDVKNEEDLRGGARAAACMHQIFRAVKPKICEKNVGSSAGGNGRYIDNNRDVNEEWLCNGIGGNGRYINNNKGSECENRNHTGDNEKNTGNNDTSRENSLKKFSEGICQDNLSVSVLANQESYEKLWNRRKKEILRVQSYVKRRHNKNPFEQMIMRETPYYAGQADEALELLQRISKKIKLQICHGDFHYHNLIYGKQENWICQSSRFHLGYQIADFYLFLRKCMEKQGWNWYLAKDLLALYFQYCPVSEEELRMLYCLFLFPEKYWKQLNFYVQSNKAWMPEKNIVKLKSLLAQEEKRQEFLKNLQEFIFIV